MKAFYSDTFVLPLPPHHRFPMAKYRRVRERVVAERLTCASPGRGTFLRYLPTELVRG